MSKNGLEEDKQTIYIRWLRQAASRRPAIKDELYTHAFEVAQAAAQLLRERYGVSRVRVFGSLVHSGRFHEDSDIDLAVEGLKVDNYWDAVTSTLFLDDQFPIELVDRATCRPEIWEVVEREGVEL